MRLTNSQQNIIKQTVAAQFDKGTKVRLFGSRADDNLRGGDIDLLLEFNAKTAQLASKILRLNSLLQKQLGAQKIDIITLEAHQTPNAIQQQALKTGVLL
ncbi:MAG: nucleotidyltransferase domain-containing protein [Candidatus Thioglobus sp.]|nr:nucleotidyltransferase domain-containing protein [Candidatus Thioglobus sp.]